MSLSRGVLTKVAPNCRHTVWTMAAGSRSTAPSTPSLEWWTSGARGALIKVAPNGRHMASTMAARKRPHDQPPPAARQRGGSLTSLSNSAAMVWSLRASISPRSCYLHTTEGMAHATSGRRISTSRPGASRDRGDTAAHANARRPRSAPKRKKPVLPAALPEAFGSDSDGTSRKRARQIASRAAPAVFSQGRTGGQVGLQAARSVFTTCTSSADGRDKAPTHASDTTAGGWRRHGGEDGSFTSSVGGVAKLATKVYAYPEAERRKHGVVREYVTKARR